MIRHSALLLAAAGLALGLGGCTGTANRGIDSVHQPVIDRADYLLDLRAAGDGLAPGERARLAGWFDALQLGYGDRVAVDGDGARARAEVGGVVAAYGMLVGDDPAPRAAPIAPGTVRVVVSRMRASTPACPDWSRRATFNYDQHTSSNFGCAVNGNLAAMVASPADLVRGQTGGGAVDPAVSGKAIQSFRKRAPTGEGALKSERSGR